MPDLRAQDLVEVRRDSLQGLVPVEPRIQLRTQANEPDIDIA
jgi:hypothetical protein